MSRSKERGRYWPGPPGLASVVEAEGRWTLQMTRAFDHPRARLWELLTDPERLREWAPFDTAFDLGETGTTTLSMAGTAKPVDLPSHIRRAEVPSLLEYTFGRDVLLWELEPMMEVTLLTLNHTSPDRESLADMAAGWQICLDVLERLLDGRPIGRIVAEDAKRFGRERLRDEFAARFESALPSAAVAHAARTAPSPPALHA